MRKILTLTLLSFVSFSGFSQKGEWIAGGSIGFGIANTEYEDGFNTRNRSIYFDINPEIAANFAKTWQVGVGVLYAHVDTKITRNGSFGGSSYTTAYKAYGPELFVRKFFPVTKSFSPFVELNGKYLWNEPAFPLNNLYGVSLDLGAAFTLSDRTKLFFSYEVLYLKFGSEDGERRQTEMGFTLLPTQGGPNTWNDILPLRFGFYYVFRQSPSLSKAPE